MSEELRNHIAEIFDGAAWEPVTGRLVQNGTPWELWKFEHDVDFDEQCWRCVIIQKVMFDPCDTDAVDYAEDVFSAAWPL